MNRFYNKKLREATKDGAGSFTHSRTARVLVGTAAVVGGLYFGGRALRTTIDERVEDVVEDIQENPQEGARAAYQILGAAVDKALPELSKLVAERYNTSPAEVQKLGRFAYAVVALDDGTDQSLLGNVTLANAQIGQQNGTLTVTHQDPGQLQRVYSLRTLALPGGGVKLIAQEIDQISGGTFGTLQTVTAQPVQNVPAAPAAQNYKPAAPTTPAPMAPPVQAYKPAAAATPPAPGNVTAYTPTTATPALPLPSIGSSLFKPVTR